MKRGTCAAITLGLAVALATPGPALVAQEPSLAELAAREKARRKAQRKEKGEARSFTEEDLASAKGQKVSRPASEQGPTVQTRPQEQTTRAPLEGEDDGAGDGGENPEGRAGREGRGGQEASFARRAADLRERIGATEARIPSLEQQIEQLRNDVNPNPPDLLDPNRLQTRQAAIEALRGQVDAARAELDGLRKEYTDLLEQARRAGVSASALEGRD